MINTQKGIIMTTYNQIQSWIRDKYGYSVKTCWIAHVKELYGIPMREAPNRASSTARKNPCPNNKIKLIKDALKHYDMID